ncbi:MAG: hypothetical protein KTR28_08345 [Micavibrio sp.]|nr:hypothetical protein [Micavibrio sp.]
MVASSNLARAATPILLAVFDGNGYDGGKATKIAASTISKNPHILGILA